MKVWNLLEHSLVRKSKALGDLPHCVDLVFIDFFEKCKIGTSSLFDLYL
jgi:hypothetical protein